MIGPDVPSFGGPVGPASAPIELIDIIFALSNVRLVREIVQNNLRQLNELEAVGKGQTEGLKAMILQKQKQVQHDLSTVEVTLNGIVEQSVAGGQNQRDISLGPDESQALIYALTVTITHLMKFMPQPQGGPVGPGGPGGPGGGIPGTII